LAKTLVEYFTKYSDYMANEQIEPKEIAVMQRFLEPFRWFSIASEREKLGNASDLYVKCLESDAFWNGLKSSHCELRRVRYSSGDGVDATAVKEMVDQIQMAL